MTANPATFDSEASTNTPQNVFLGSVTALAQSAWMGFALAKEIP